MKYTILTNFNDYEHNISINEKGIITLTLTPKYLDSILLKKSRKLKKGRSCFDRKFCTLYKKNDNDYLYRFTNWEPLSFATLDNNKIINSFECEIPTKNYTRYINNKYSFIVKYYKSKLDKLEKKYNSYYSKQFN